MDEPLDPEHEDVKVLDLNTIGLPAVEVDPGELVFGAMLVLQTRRMVSEGTGVRFIFIHNHDLDFVTRRGMIELASDTVREWDAGVVYATDDDEDGTSDSLA